MRIPADAVNRLMCAVFVVSTFAAARSIEAAPPEPVLLWPDGAPGAVGEEEADRPSIRIYPAEQPNGAGVVICPGGGYGHLAMNHEGHQIARWLNELGVTAVVLKYRHRPRYGHPAPLLDVQRAIRYLRSHAEELHVDPDRLGVMGFSAGGHLASTVSTHFDEGDPAATDPIDRESCRPDFAVLGYPVISLRAPYAHAGSRKNLLGENPDPALVESLSNETQVTDQTPPTFLFHTAEDSGVPAENSLDYFRALREHGVPAELHVYQNGPHGIGLGIADPVVFTWKDRLADWLQTNGFLADVVRAEVSGTITLNRKPIPWGTITFIPASGGRQPVAGGRISNGKYRIPLSRGPVVGRQNVIVRALGEVFPGQSVHDVVTVSDQSGRVIAVTIEPGRNELDFDLETVGFPLPQTAPVEGRLP